MKKQENLILNFAGGINQAIDESFVQPNEAIEAANIDIEKGILKRAAGFVAYANEKLSQRLNDKIIQIYKYEKLSGAIYYIIQAGTKLYFTDDIFNGDLLPSGGYALPNPYGKLSFLTYNDRLWICNEGVSPLIWNGEYDNNGNPILLDSSNRYIIRPANVIGSYVSTDEHGVKYTSQIIVQPNLSGQKWLYSGTADAPVANPVPIHISFRNGAEILTELQDIKFDLENNQTILTVDPAIYQTYGDLVLPSAMDETTKAGETIYIGLGIPATGGLAEVKLATVFLNDVIEPDKIYYSEVQGSVGFGYYADDPKAWDKDTYFLNINPGDGDKITALKFYNSDLYVFKTHSIFVIKGYSSANFAIYNISNIVGCSNPKSIIEHNGSLYFWGNDGLYRLTGNQLEYISNKIRKITDSLYVDADTNIQEQLYKRSDWEAGDYNDSDFIITDKVKLKPKTLSIINNKSNATAVLKTKDDTVIENLTVSDDDTNADIDIDTDDKRIIFRPYWYRDKEKQIVKTYNTTLNSGTVTVLGQYVLKIVNVNSTTAIYVYNLENGSDFTVDLNLTVGLNPSYTVRFIKPKKWEDKCYIVYIGGSNLELYVDYVYIDSNNQLQIKNIGHINSTYKTGQNNGFAYAINNDGTELTVFNSRQTDLNIIIQKVKVDIDNAPNGLNEQNILQDDIAIPSEWFYTTKAIQKGDDFFVLLYNSLTFDAIIFKIINDNNVYSKIAESELVLHTNYYGLQELDLLENSDKIYLWLFNFNTDSSFNTDYTVKANVRIYNSSDLSNIKNLDNIYTPIVPGSNWADSNDGWLDVGTNYYYDTSKNEGYLQLVYVIQLFKSPNYFKRIYVDNLRIYTTELEIQNSNVSGIASDLNVAVNNLFDDYYFDTLDNNPINAKFIYKPTFQRYLENMYAIENGKIFNQFFVENPTYKLFSRAEYTTKLVTFDTTNTLKQILYGGNLLGLSALNIYISIDGGTSFLLYNADDEYNTQNGIKLRLEFIPDENISQLNAPYIDWIKFYTTEPKTAKSIKAISYDKNLIWLYPVNANYDQIEMLMLTQYGQWNHYDKYNLSDLFEVDFKLYGISALSNKIYYFDKQSIAPDSYISALYHKEEAIPGWRVGVSKIGEQSRYYWIGSRRDKYLTKKYYFERNALKQFRALYILGKGKFKITPITQPPLRKWRVGISKIGDSSSDIWSVLVDHKTEDYIRIPLKGNYSGRYIQLLIESADDIDPETGEVTVNDYEIKSVDVEYIIKRVNKEEETPA